jgi:O-acetyl-ADP-ribose deacetylase (regulator of RNase III)
MIRIDSGDMFKSGAEALVNPVNTVGVMGGGLALVFKNKYPKAFNAYKWACDNGYLQPGTVMSWPIDNNQIVIHFPTKLHYRNPSLMEYVETGLDDLILEIRHLNIKSIAIPALGCGLGGLDWADVEPLIREKLAVLNDVDIILYPPKEAF